MIEIGTLVRVYGRNTIGRVIGQDVCRETHPVHSLNGTMIVSEIVTTRYVVKWPDGCESTIDSSFLAPVLCANCGYDATAHNDSWKCFYGPGQWGF